MNNSLHAEIKDKYSGLEVQLDEIGVYLREIPFDYKLIDEFGKIDQEIGAIQNWYEHAKIKIAKYESQKKNVEYKIESLIKRIQRLNNEVQSIKLQASSRDLHKDLCLP